MPLDPSRVHEQYGTAPLNEAEIQVILRAGTEAPFSGALLHNQEAGVYNCRLCGSPLFRSEDKFDSGSGWPSFDDEIPGAIARHPDPDGYRTEISCATCGAHLGHVFAGEHLTPKDLRHCVNSIALTFTPASATEEKPDSGLQNAYFAGGCFWGVEAAFSELDGVLDVVSGYSGGIIANPSYEQVCTGRTGHAETVRVSYDPAKISFEQLARRFFEIHDPTTVDRQGLDVGSQYRSAIFYNNEQERETAQHLIDLLKARGWNVVTELEPVGPFYPAEDYHQDYLEKHGRSACHIAVPRFDRDYDGR